METSKSTISFDGIGDYINIGEPGSIGFFACPIDWRTILHILRALIKNWGMGSVVIINKGGRT